MATTKERISAGQTLVAKYKGDQHSCEVVEHEEKLYFVLPGGEVFKSPSAAGHVITGIATNGSRFWSVPEQMPGVPEGRQRAARAAGAPGLADRRFDWTQRSRVGVVRLRAANGQAHSALQGLVDISLDAAQGDARTRLEIADKRITL